VKLDIFSGAIKMELGLVDYQPMQEVVDGKVSW
jgi:hypothetical protein